MYLRGKTENNGNSSINSFHKFPQQLGLGWSQPDRQELQSSLLVVPGTPSLEPGLLPSRVCISGK